MSSYFAPRSRDFSLPELSRPLVAPASRRTRTGWHFHLRQERRWKVFHERIRRAEEVRRADLESVELPIEPARP